MESESISTSITDILKSAFDQTCRAEYRNWLLFPKEKPTGTKAKRQKASNQKYDTQAKYELSDRNGQLYRKAESQATKGHENRFQARRVISSELALRERSPVPTSRRKRARGESTNNLNQPESSSMGAGRRTRSRVARDGAGHGEGTGHGEDEV